MTLFSILSKNRRYFKNCRLRGSFRYSGLEKQALHAVYCDWKRATPVYHIVEVFSMSQLIMSALLFLPNRISPGWADGVAGTLEFFSAVIPPPFNWLIVVFLRAL